MKDIKIITNKRFQKEIGIYLEPIKSKFLKKNKNVTLLDFDFNSAKFKLDITEKISIYINIEIQNGYPFKKPFIKVNNINYFNYLKIEQNKLNEIGNKLCLCCNSILCNWYAAHTIYLLLNEVTENFKLKLRLLNRFYCKKITNQIFGTYIPIIEFL